MKRKISICIVLLIPALIIAQHSIDEVLQKYNTESVPYIHTKALAHIMHQAVILDAREQKEFEVSHIQGAIPVGYTDFDMNIITQQKIDKKTPIVVYCSLGVRSEDIAEQLQKEGYSNVYNLYGGIFEWKNDSYPVVDHKEHPTEKVHAYSKEWGKWLRKGKKVYSK